MQKINGPGHLNNTFVAEDPAINRPPTEITAEWLNSIQGELVALSTLNGANLDLAKNDQASAAVVDVIQRNALNTVTDTGLVNAYVANMLPAPSALAEGLWCYLKVSNTNAGPSTLNLNNHGAKPIVGLAHIELQGGELIQNGTALLRYSKQINSWVLLGCGGAPQQVAPAEKAQHALQKQQKGIVTHTVSGYWTVPDGVTSVYISACAGGGGGGAGGGGAQNWVGAGGSGGGAGQWMNRQQYNVTPRTNVNFTLGGGGSGAAGTGSAGTNGTAGGNTVITGLLGGTVTLIGGAGGSGGPNVNGSTVGGPAGGAGYPQGQNGGDGFNNGGTAFGGSGGGTPFGSGGFGGRPATGSSALSGLAGYGFGGGGGGGYYPAGSAATASGGSGANGLPGFIRIEW